MCDANSAQISRSLVCAAVVNPGKIVFGTDEGLFSYELTKESVARIDDVKKVVQVEMIPDEQLLVVLSGELTSLCTLLISQLIYLFLTTKGTEVC